MVNSIERLRKLGVPIEVGVDDGLGGFPPNSTTTIVTDNYFNLRPISLKVLDIDDDELAKIEKVFIERAKKHGELKQLADDILLLKKMRWI